MTTNAKKKEKKYSKFSERIRSIKRSYREHAAIKYLIIVSTFIILIVGLLGKGIMATHVSNQNDTTLKDWTQIAAGYSVGMTKKAYNPKSELMQVSIELRNNDMTGSVYPRLKFSTKTLNQQPKVKTEVIRAGDSSYILVLKNLKPKFGAVLIKVSTDLKTNQTNNSTENLSDESLDNSNDTINSNDTNESKLDNGTVNIYINEISKLIDNNLTYKNKKQYWIETVNNEITHLKSEIKILKNHISSTKVKIDIDKKAITKNEEGKRYNTDKEIEKIDQENEQTRSDIQSNESAIKKMKSSIDERKKKINLLNQKIKDIKNGSYSLI